MNARKLNGVLDHLLAKAVEEAAAKKFHYSSYWGNWSRVLLRPGDIVPSGSRKGEISHDYLELNLTPINGWHPWNHEEIEKRVRPIVFRFHGTARDRKDRDEKELPGEVLKGMKENLGDLLVERLINEDFLWYLDLDALYRNMRGGGVALSRFVIRRNF
jgi:hypothetical protein